MDTGAAYNVLYLYTALIILGGRQEMQILAHGISRMSVIAKGHNVFRTKYATKGDSRVGYFSLTTILVFETVMRSHS
jgi:hypothetical protein